MVTKAPDATVEEEVKDIRPPVYQGNPLNLDQFWEKVNKWEMTVTEDVDLVQAKKYVFKRLGSLLPEVLQDLYFVASMEGEIKILKDADRWLVQ